MRIYSSRPGHLPTPILTLACRPQSKALHGTSPQWLNFRHILGSTGASLEGYTVGSHKKWVFGQDFGKTGYVAYECSWRVKSKGQRHEMELGAGLVRLKIRKDHPIVLHIPTGSRTLDFWKNFHIASLPPEAKSGAGARMGDEKPRYAGSWKHVENLPVAAYILQGRTRQNPSVTWADGAVRCGHQDQLNKKSVALQCLYRISRTKNGRASKKTFELSI